jgi:hypothetical protein
MHGPIRPAITKEPAPQQDAAVLKEAITAYHNHDEGPVDVDGLEAVIAVARKGVVSIEAVEKAMEEQWMVPAYQNKDAWVAGVLARLTAPKPPSKQDAEKRVTIVEESGDFPWAVYVDGHRISGHGIRNSRGYDEGAEGMRRRFIAALELEKGASHE